MTKGADRGDSFMRIAILVGALVVALATAGVFAVWPVVGGAPWLSREVDSQLAPDEVIELVRRALCPGRPFMVLNIAPQVNAKWKGRGAWTVEAYVGGARPSVDPGEDWAHWKVVESTGLVIPSDEAARKEADEWSAYPFC